MTFWGKFFPSQVPEFLHVLFNLVFNVVEKHIFLAEMLVLLCCIHCARFNILSLFSQKQSANQAKKYRGLFYYLIEKHMKKFTGNFEGKKFTRKSHLGESCTEPFNCNFSLTGEQSYVMYSYIRKHDDGRVSYPFVFIFISPQGKGLIT